MKKTTLRAGCTISFILMIESLVNYLTYLLNLLIYPYAMTILLDYYSLESQPGMFDFPHIMNYRLTILLAFSVIFLWFSKRVSQERIKLENYYTYVGIYFLYRAVVAAVLTAIDMSFLAEPVLDLPNTWYYLFVSSIPRFTGMAALLVIGMVYLFKEPMVADEHLPKQMDDEGDVKTKVDRRNKRRFRILRALNVVAFLFFMENIIRVTSTGLGVFQAYTGLFQSAPIAIDSWTELVLLNTVGLMVPFFIYLWSKGKLHQLEQTFSLRRYNAYIGMYFVLKTISRTVLLSDSMARGFQLLGPGERFTLTKVLSYSPLIIPIFITLAIGLVLVKRQEVEVEEAKG